MTPIPIRISSLVRLLFFAAILTLCAAVTARAQNVPGPRVSLTFDHPMSASCTDPTVINAWNFTYGSCYLPAGVNLGDPWITHVRVTFTGTTTVSSLVPKAQVVQETLAANCQNTAPCLRINDLAAPVGASTITTRFVTSGGAEGGPSNSLPFTGNPPPVPASGGLRRVNP